MGMHILNWDVYFYGLYAIGIFAMLGWCLSLLTKQVSHVDSMWSLFFLIAGAAFAYCSQPLGDRAWLVVGLLALWSIRLSAYITWRNSGHEDIRYVEIAKNNQPHFWLKSLYIVFILQGVLAAIIALTLFAAINTQQAGLTLLDYLGAALVVFGFLWETIADWQLSNFKANATNAGKVLDQGLWGYSRHPNYFGECCVWWGFFLFALSVGAWWAIVSPLLMTLLLLKVSGVSLLESTITGRRPDYVRYIKTTNAFVPGPRKHAQD